VTNLLTLAEVSSMLRVSTRTIRRRVIAGSFPPPIRFGDARSPLWRAADVELHVTAHRAPPPAPRKPLAERGVTVASGRLWDSP
jgi:predicted DNA-binding transcriptional regulator AlpA